jgi:CubicO group peptidase (beta-lactamase class C family)
MTYFPPKHPDWRRISAADAGLDPGLVQSAAAFGAEHETPWRRDLAYMIENDFGEEPPWNEALGPVRPRGGPNGLIVRRGRVVAEWGDTTQVDLTFSVAKSYLSICAGLAFDRGLIRDMHEPVCRSVDDGGFAAPHNSKITWHHLLQQTSEWEGELWGKPDLIDRNRTAGGVSMSRGAKKGTHRDLQEPGTFWEYNDVRVNRLSLALLRIWRRPLPEVFRDLVMDPIGASHDWDWQGYRNSHVEIDGRRMQSVAGGSHWGGGMFIHARDQARIGLLMLNDGVWNGQRILSSEWIRRMRVPCDIFPGYGYFWWLNPGRKPYPEASESSYFAMGAGGNMTWIDPDNDIVAVMRWIDPAARNGFMRLVSQAVRA